MCIVELQWLLIPDVLFSTWRNDHRHCPKVLFECCLLARYSDSLFLGFPPPPLFMIKEGRGNQKRSISITRCNLIYFRVSISSVYYHVHIYFA